MAGCERLHDQVGDRVHLDGSTYTVVDMVSIPGNGKRLVFEEGRTHILGEFETLYAYRAEKGTP